MPPFTLRPATKKDTGAIRSLIRSARINPLGLDWRRFVVATASAEGIIGCGQVKVHRSGAYELASIAVSPNWQERGVASAIIGNLLCIHDKPMYLTCRSSLKDFYQKFGFRVLENVNEMPPYFRLVSKFAHWMGKLGFGRESLLVMLRE
jgi:N-acetylglutamate synthase-like GNAT family acetyltransferase